MDQLVQLQDLYERIRLVRLFVQAHVTRHELAEQVNQFIAQQLAIGNNNDELHEESYDILRDILNHYQVVLNELESDQPHSENYEADNGNVNGNSEMRSSNGGELNSVYASNEDNLTLDTRKHASSDHEAPLAYYLQPNSSSVNTRDTQHFADSQVRIVYPVSIPTQHEQLNLNMIIPGRNLISSYIPPPEQACTEPSSMSSAAGPSWRMQASIQCAPNNPQRQLVEYDQQPNPNITSCRNLISSYIPPPEQASTEPSAMSSAGSSSGMQASIQCSSNNTQSQPVENNRIAFYQQAFASLDNDIDEANQLLDAFRNKVDRVLLLQEIQESDVDVIVSRDTESEMKDLRVKVVQLEARKDQLQKEKLQLQQRVLAIQNYIAEILDEKAKLTSHPQSAVVRTEPIEAKAIPYLLRIKEIMDKQYERQKQQIARMRTEATDLDSQILELHELLEGYKKVMKELHLADLELKFGKEFVIWKESGDKLLENNLQLEQEAKKLESQLKDARKIEEQVASENNALRLQLDKLITTYNNVSGSLITNPGRLLGLGPTSM